MNSAHASAAEEAPAADAPRTEAPRRHPLRRAAGHSLEDRVQVLTKGLDLDPTQQAALRRLLESQREQIRQVWADRSTASDHVGAIRAILDRTGDRIRTMLNDEQRKRYILARPQRGKESPAQGDVEHWMQLANPAARQDARAVN